MASGQKELITRVSEGAWVDADKLAASVPDAVPPVNLEVYAKNLAIRHVRVKPLISDAGLAKGSSDLEIIVNTQAPGISLLAGFSASVGDGTWLKFQPSLRFTVAHEIAHAVFLRAAGWDSGRDLLDENRKDVERGCNRLARLMLLPRQMLVREIGERFFDLDRVDGVCTAFRISPQVFVRRFHLSDMKGQFLKLDGLLAFVEERSSRLVILACHVLGSYAVRRFHLALLCEETPNRQESEYSKLSKRYRETKCAAEGMALSDPKLGLQKDIESVLRSKETGRLEMDVDWGDGDAIPCEVVFRQIHREPLGYWVRIQVLGPKQKPGQRELF